MELTTVLAFLVYGCCFLFYHWIYLSLTERRPNLTKKGRINDCYASWLKKTADRDQHLLLVHQLRNMIMSITFLASASILLVGFLLTYGLTGLSVTDDLAISGSLNYPVWLVFFTLAFSFLNLLLALRHINNLTVLVRSDPDKLEKIEGGSAPAYLEKLFRKGTQRYMLGRRGFLYGIVIFFWYVDVWVFVGLTILLTATLAYQHDF
ncbi:DUF599 domain-containing protein [Candidatus Bipolaricaulota bacterium]|nr:DUF599 domain-containing protein [Candidatus Bipolaricaulota bacterium]